MTKAKAGGGGETPAAAGGEVVVAALREINVRRVQMVVEGTTPLIVHAWSVKAVRQMEDAQQKKAKAGRGAKNPDAEYQGCFYRDARGRYCFPAAAFKKAMVTAATSIDDKRFPKTKIRQAVFVNGDLLPIVTGTEPAMRTDPVRLNGGTADIRYRPEFADWRVELDIEFNANVISTEQVVNLLNLAGFAVGVGEWRPEKDGNNGRFRVVSRAE